jgi:hypothetical protein
MWTLSLTPWSTALLDMLTVSQPVKKFLTIYGRFITAFTTARCFFPNLCQINPVDFFKTYSKSFHLRPVLSGFCGLVVSMLESGTQDRGTAVLRSIPNEAFADSFQKIYERCQQCVVKDDDYFEGQ